MPHSLKNKIKSLCYKGEISEKERDKIIHALEIMQGIEDAYMREILKTPLERGIPISDECDGCRYELNSTNGNLCYSCGKYKLTEQQPCEDCISRADAIKIFGEVHPLDYNKQSYIANIQKLPSATPKARWIPVSERLPKENGFYLATCDGEICGENEPFTGLAEYENGKWVDDEEDYQCVLAWMPLPQPYRESEV